MKRFRRPALYVFLASLAAACVWVSSHPRRVVAANTHPMQTTHNAMHQMVEKLPPGIINGRLHPELIPDSAAYRLFFLAASNGGQSPTPEQVERRSIVLSHAGLNPDEITKAIAILANFRTSYSTLESEYNSSWAVQQGSDTGWNRFIAERDALVQSTRDQLGAALSAKAMTAFSLKVQAEKVHMRVPESEARQ